MYMKPWQKKKRACGKMYLGRGHCYYIRSPTKKVGPPTIFFLFLSHPQVYFAASEVFLPHLNIFRCATFLFFATPMILDPVSPPGGRALLCAVGDHIFDCGRPYIVLWGPFFFCFGGGQLCVVGAYFFWWGVWGSLLFLVGDPTLCCEGPTGVGPSFVMWENLLFWCGENVFQSAKRFLVSG